MRIQLSELKPNPERDFRVDPLHEPVIAALTASITEDGFWGGVTARPAKTGGYEIAAGHHRVEAARRAGMTEAEIFVADFDDETMVRIYARENATQRNNHVTAIDGSVLAATRLIVKQLLNNVGTSGDFAIRGIFESDKAFDTAKGQLQTDKGIGRDLVKRVLGDMPGMTERSIRDSLERLKSSGAYARNVQAIAGNVDSEVAIKAVNAAAQQEITFDLEGVVPYLPNPNQISAFQKLAEKFKQHLPLDSQAPLAKALRDDAAEQDKELSANFIHQNFLIQLGVAKRQERAFASQEEEERFRLASYQEKFEAMQIEAARLLRSSVSTLTALQELREIALPGLALPFHPILRRASHTVAELLYKLHKEYSL